MSNFLIEAILTHHNHKVITCNGLLLASKCGKCYCVVNGYSLQQLKDYLNS